MIDDVHQLQMTQAWICRRETTRLAGDEEHITNIFWISQIFRENEVPNVLPDS